MTRQGGKSNDSMYEKYSVRMCANGVVELEKRKSLRLFDNSERINSQESVKNLFG